MSAQNPNQPIYILKEGTERNTGNDARGNNIMAAKIVAEAVKTSLGPKGMDKMLVDSFGDVTITNDGATMLKEMDIQHPAAKMMVEVSKTQDSEVGDGTTSVVVIAGELLNKASDLMEKKVHPTVIIDGYREAQEEALKVLDEISIKVKPKDKDTLKRVAKTTMSTKLVSGHGDHLSGVAVDAVLQVAEEANGGYKVDLDMVKVEKKPGGSMTDTALIKGLVIDKEVVHSDMPKLVKNAKIGLLDAAMEIEKTEFTSKISIESPEEMQAYLDQEEKMLRDMVGQVKSAGITVLLCQKGIDDMVQHFLAREGIMAARRLKKSDMEALAKATGAKVVSSVDELSASDAGYAASVEEKKIGSAKRRLRRGEEDRLRQAHLRRGVQEPQGGQHTHPRRNGEDRRRGREKPARRTLRSKGRRGGPQDRRRRRRRRHRDREEAPRIRREAQGQGETRRRRIRRRYRGHPHHTRRERRHGPHRRDG